MFTTQQVSFGLPYNFTYTYNLAGALTKEVYPSGREIRMEYDTAGRPAKVCNGACASNDLYAGSFVYGQYGLQTSMTLGNGVVETKSYNSLLQVAGIQAAKSSTNLFTLVNTYVDGNNNGNLWGQTINGVWRAYSYDWMNRLTQVDNWASWSEGYSYDRYGNRAVTTRTSPLPALTGETPNALTWYGTSNNRIGGSFTYDGRGNMTVAPGRTAAYDGANQMSQEQRTGGPAVYYWYDAAGKRVGKNDGTTATIFVYDAVGRLAEEFSGPTTGFANQNVTAHIYGAGHLATEKTGLGRQYYTTDHLGSTRVITDASGGVVSASDYLPFGEEIGVGCGTLASGVKFTSQYRDQESCLGYFVSRYMSPAQGRFTSPDAPLPIRTAVIRSRGICIRMSGITR